MGGVNAKVAAAKQAGAQRVLIPKENWQVLYGKMDIEVIPIEHISEAIPYAILDKNEITIKEIHMDKPDILAASGVTTQN